MKTIVKIILLLLIGFGAKAQLPASTFNSRWFTGNTRAEWIILDSPLVNKVMDTFYARYPGTQIVRIQGGDTAFWFYGGNRRWFRPLLDRDTVSLSNRINLKLNISDTAAMLLPYLRKADTTNKWVQDVYVRNDSLFKFKNGAETFLDTLGNGGGSSGTVTSVALSMPSAFTVTGSPITTSGTFAVSGAGTSLQYIRGNGTLATTDTGMIPNFHLKVRSLITGTSPITVNQTTGLLSIINATATGTKGAAAFTGAFSDNGSGLIDLLDLVTAGSCTNCNITFDAKGRATAFTNGTGPSGASVDTLWRTPGVDSIYFTINGGAQQAIKDSTGNINISNASLTANGSYSHNWSENQWVVDSIGTQFLFRMGGVGNTGTRRKEFRINWGGSSFGDQMDGYNILASIKKADLSADSLTMGLQSSGTGVLSMGAYDVAVSANNTFISYNMNSGLININAKDSIWIKGAVPSATADSALGILSRGPGASKVVKFPVPTGGTGGGLVWEQSATALTGDDTAKLWVKTPSRAAVYDVFTYVNSRWERFGWLDSVSNVFSTKRPLTFVGGGQSNMGSVGPGGDTAYIKGMIAWSTGAAGGIAGEFQDKWIAARIGLSPFFGDNNNIVFQMAKRAIRHGDADIVRVILTFEGGTSLAAWIGSGGNTFLLDTMRSRLSRSGIDTIDAWAWHQGESGGISGFTDGGYVVDQRVLYDTLCSPLTVGFKRNYTKYIAGGLGDLAAADSAQTWNVGSPEGGQRTLNFDGNLNTAWVPSWGLGHVDNTHFSGTGIDSLGYRYYTEMIRLPHAPYVEEPEFNYDTTYDQYKVYVDRLVPYNGGGSSMKYIDDISMAYMRSNSPLFTINGTTTSGTVNLGAQTGYSDAVPKMFQVNGKALISDGSFNTIISGNWNVTGNPAHNVVIANYPLTFNPASGGDESVLIGYSAGYTGSSNMPFNSVVIGSEAGNGNSSANFNVYIGRSSGAGVTGVHNTFSGYQSGQNSQGSSNTSIGSNANALNSTARVNATAIGANAKYNEDSVFVAGNAIKRFIMGGTTSLPFLIGAPSNGQYYSWNTSNSQFELTNAPSGATTLYSGDGTIAGNRDVNVNNLNLTFSDANIFRVNYDVFVQSKADGTFPYSSIITGAAQNFQMAYTPTPGTFSKGSAVLIDTNNNVGIGTLPSSTAPLYATGNSAYINGLQSQSGNFYAVANITSDQTATIQQYWFNIDATSGNVTVTLPAASAAFGGSIGIQYVFRRVDNSGNTVTIARAGSDLINGATSVSLATQYAVEEIQCVSTSAWALKQP